jgi:hypothetical protein
MSLFRKAELTETLIKELMPSLFTYSQVEEFTGASSKKEVWGEILQCENLKGSLDAFVLNECKFTGHLYCGVPNKMLKEFQKTWKSNGINALTLNELIEFDNTNEFMLPKMLTHYKFKSKEKRFIPRDYLARIDDYQLKSSFPYIKHVFHIMYNYSSGEYILSPSSDLVIFVGSNMGHLVISSGRNKNKQPASNTLIKGIINSQFDGSYAYHINDFYSELYGPIDNAPDDYEKNKKNLGQFKQTINRKLRPFLEEAHKLTGIYLTSFAKDTLQFLDFVIYDKDEQIFKFNYDFLFVDQIIT